MKCFSLFSGIGGFDLAAKNLGMELVCACEDCCLERADMLLSTIERKGLYE